MMRRGMGMAFFSHFYIFSSSFVQHMLASTKLHEAATDCICSLLYVCEDASKYGALPLTMKNYVDQLKPVFLAAVEAEDSDM